ncbi:MAG: hydroxyacid dehydrogenase [Bacteroidales bacterium]|nr:hydroxyacid dehydrogenase [Bacteroidales bacterium]MBN2749593.1 hydroxyacid dehydrogenase [Bacteroidales bacterium]
MNLVFAEPIGLTDKEKSDFAAEMQLQSHAVTFFDAVPSTQDELLERALAADVLVVSNYPVSEQVVKGAQSLKYIVVAFTGTDHVAQDACAQRGILISNAAGYSTQAVAELTIAMALDLLRKVTPADAVTRSLGGRNGFLGLELQGKTFGIVGMGLIGERVALLAKAFGCRVIAWSRTVKAIDGVEFVSFDDVLSQADILSLHVPLTPQTKGLIGALELGKMKPSAMLINTARALVVDTSALADALREGVIAGAAVDIYEKEPPLEAEYPLLSVPNVLLLPHIAFATHEAIALRSGIVLQNIRGWLSGKPQNVVG